MTISFGSDRIFERSTLPSVVMDPQTARFLDCNPAAATMYGFGSVADTLGKTPSDVSAPVQYDGTPAAQKVKEYVERCLSEGSIVFEWRHQRPDGEVWDAQVHLMRFVANDKVLLQFTLLDITERVHAIRALRESEAKYPPSPEVVTTLGVPNRLSSTP